MQTLIGLPNEEVVAVAKEDMRLGLAQACEIELRRKLSEKKYTTVEVTRVKTKLASKGQRCITVDSRSF